jgi:outer membrane immunogenic protein
MKTLLLAGAAIGASIFHPAFSADLRAPVTKAPPSPPPPLVYNWTGFYVGAHAGAIWSSSDHTTVMEPGSHVSISQGLVSAAGTGSNDRTGFIGGGQIGYNWQASGSHWVLGLEADFSGVPNNKGSHTGTGVLANGLDTFSISHSSGFDWLATVRGRLGYAFGPSLIYVTGGVAVADLNVSSSYSDTLGGTGAGSVSETKAGWTVGGGWEYALSRNWSVKAEYLYVHFDDATVTYTVTHPTRGTNLTNASSSFDSNHIARAGLNYKF